MRAPALLLLLLLVSCGQGAPPDPDAAPPAAETAAAPGTQDVAALLAGVPRAAAEGRSVRYEAVTEGALEGEPSAVEARMSGVLDTVAGAGTADVELVALDDLAADAVADGEPGPGSELAALARVRLAWTATDVTLHLGGEEVTGPRADADSGVYARVPGEPAGLFEVVARATGVRVVGSEVVDGLSTTHLQGSAQPRAAVEAGLGTQAQLTIARLPELPVEVWLDQHGRPARIRYTVQLPSLQQGRTRTMVTTYDYRDWGQPVDVTP